MIEVLARAQGMIGIALICALAWALSENRKQLPPWAWIGGALAMQVAMAVIVLRVPLVWDVLAYATKAVTAIEQATLVGSSYIFGYLGGAPLPFDMPDQRPAPVIIAFQILPLVIVFSALSAMLWHWGVLRAAVGGIAWALRGSLRVSGVVGLGAGANLFLGVVESPLVLRAYLERINRSDLFAIMVLTMSTISGAILILYATTLSATVPNAVAHMISASLLSLPAAILIAQLMVPAASTTTPATAEADDTSLSYHSTMDALIRGTFDGIQLFLAVIGVIIVVFALVALTDQALALLPDIAGAPLTLKRFFGWLFAPFMWSLGVPWSEAPAAGTLMGTKAILNEYVAYLELAALPQNTFSPRSLLIVTYALCGVANLASIGLLVSTIGTLAPTRRAEVAGLGIKSWIAGNFASAMTGAVIGLVS